MITTTYKYFKRFGGDSCDDRYWRVSPDSLYGHSIGVDYNGDWQTHWHLHTFDTAAEIFNHDGVSQIDPNNMPERLIHVLNRPTSGQWG